MKKLKFVIALLLSVALLVMAAACGGGYLETPSAFDIDEENTLSWREVDGARSYRIEIKTVATGEVTEETSHPAHYSLSTLEEGDYEIRVMAVGGSQASALTSEWSDAVIFHKNFETGLIYELINNNTEYRIQRVGSATGDVVIEDEYRGKPVTEIAERAFRASARITGVTVGNNVRTINAFAFYNCQSLSSVTIPDSVETMGESVFQGCKALTSIKLPARLEAVPVRAFAYCRNLESVEFGASVYAVLDSAFYGCSALRAVDLPDSVAYIGDNAFGDAEALQSVHFGSGITLIYNYAFNYDDGLTEITFDELDDGVELSIGVGAFQACPALEEIVLPEGLVELGDGVFDSCEKLETVTLPESLRIVGQGVFGNTALYNAQIGAGDGYVYAGRWLVDISADKKNSLVIFNAETMREDAQTVGIAAAVFAGAEKLEEVHFPASVKYIGYRSFYQCPLLWWIDGERNGLEYIGHSAFANCGSLSQPGLPEGLLEIEDYAFYGCPNVINPPSGLLIPNSVTRIGIQAFANTGIVSDRTVRGVLYAGHWVVGYDSDQLGSDVTLKQDTVGIADYAFSDAVNLTNVGNMNRVQYIGEGAFARCEQLAGASLNVNMREIKPYTFYKCSSLFLVELPMMLQTVGAYSFYVCQRLGELDFTRTQLETVGSHAFFECNNVTGIRLGNNVKVIEDYAFYHCAQVEELVIPGTVTTIGERAFGRCENLKTLSIGEGVEEIGAFAFRECTRLEAIELPDTVKRIGEYAFYKCTAVASLKMSESAEYIGGYAFYGNGFGSVSLPASLQYIGDAAFKACLNLRSVILHGTTATVGAHVFFANDESNSYGLNGLTVYLVGETGKSWTGSWNSTRRPVVQGCTLSEEGYVHSVTVSEGSILNGYVWNGLAAPVRAGYTFAGWAASETATEAEYGLNDLIEVPAGTTLYAVWVQAPAPSEEA